MHWNEVSTKTSELYGSIAGWVYDHPVETDLLIMGAVAFALVKYYQSRHVKRRRTITLQRGCWMSRDQRQKLQMMRFEDAITDASLDMLVSGEMNSEDERFWNNFFADNYKFIGLLPAPLSKAARIRGAITRIKFYKRYRPNIPGGLPVVTADPNYVPTKAGAETGSLSTSRYAKKPTEK